VFCAVTVTPGKGRAPLFTVPCSVPPDALASGTAGTACWVDGSDEPGVVLEGACVHKLAAAAIMHTAALARLALLCMHLPVRALTERDVARRTKVYRAGAFHSIVNLVLLMQQTRPSTIRIVELNQLTPAATLAAAHELLLEYGRFVVAQPGAARFCFGSLEKEAARLPESYLEQDGGCLLASVGNEPAGFIAWRAIAASAQVADGSWEMKRLWVRPTARGLRLGRLLTEAVLDRARQAHRSAVFLDTAPASMGAAYSMYLEMGFAPCAAYNNNPVEGLAYLVKYIEPSAA
jgi:ribosomal protein S18 acetylase RimI-like enzyme